MQFHHLVQAEIAEKSKLNSLDPRLKLVFSLLGLLIIISTNKVVLPLGAVILCTSALIGTGTPKSYLLKRIIPALYIGGMVLLTQIFLYGSTILFQYSLGSWQIVGYQEGLQHGTLLMVRILGAMSLMIFLTATTTINQLVFAAAYFKMPQAMIEIITIAYRYIFVLLEEMERIYKAQKVRLGHKNASTSLKSFGSLGGMVILRVFDKSNKLYESMRCRGYKKTIRVTYQQSFTKNDYWASLVLAACLVAALVVGF